MASLRLYVLRFVKMLIATSKTLLLPHPARLASPASPTVKYPHPISRLAASNALPSLDLEPTAITA